MSRPSFGRVIVFAFLLAVFCARVSAAAGLTLAWDPPADGLATGYVLYYGTASRSYTQQVTVGASTSYTVSGLSGGTTYYFAVRAYDAAGVLSEFSDEVSGAPERPVVTGLSLTSNVPSPQAVGTTVTFSATATGGVTPYEFQWSVFHADEWKVGPWLPTSTGTWTPAIPGTDYTMRVAVRSAGSLSAIGELTQSVPFAIAAAGTPAPPPPGAPPPLMLSGCATPDPFAAMGGGVCYNGGWLPPGMTPGAGAPPPATPPPAPVAPPAPPAGGGGGCVGPDPFAPMGGGVCYNGGWLPPGMVVPNNPVTPPPAPPATPPVTPPATSPAPPAPAAPAGGGTCAAPNPFASMGGGTCYNGGWLPPGMPVPGGGAPLPAPLVPPAGPRACLGSDPFVSIPGYRGACVNGGWIPVRIGGI